MSSAGLRFLTDESCDFVVVRALRADGYDVVAVVLPVRPGALNDGDAGE